MAPLVRRQDGCRLAAARPADVYDRAVTAEQREHVGDVSERLVDQPQQLALVCGGVHDLLIGTDRGPQATRMAGRPDFRGVFR